jgi:NAD+---dinitrogen-reductase ADP-D-ribosyltransferase
MERLNGAPPELPRGAQLPFNRCNLPAAVLGSVGFQRQPSALELDGIVPFHRRWFEALDAVDSAQERAQRLVDYINVAFRLCHPEELGDAGDDRSSRLNATCFRMIRGWSFDANGREAAVLKGWVESRFGLRALFHNGRLDDPRSQAHVDYQRCRAVGTWGTAALESQLDVLYTFCQYELARRGRHGPGHAAPQTPLASIERLRLFRGVGAEVETDILENQDATRKILLLNSLSSFTAERDRAESFGKYILEVDVPTSKIMFHNRLIPNLLTGETEYMVIGGVYEGDLLRF